MIRSNLKAGAQGTIGTLTAVSSGTLTIPNSAGAQAVSIIANNKNEGAYTQTIAPVAGTYDSYILAMGHGGSYQNHYSAFIKPNGTDDIQFTYTFTGSASDADIMYIITP